MNLDKVVSISGKPGLYKIIAETTNRVIVSSLDNPKKKLPISANFQVALLEKITIYTTDNSDLNLPTVFEEMNKKAQEENLEVPTGKEAPHVLQDYFKQVAPKHDPERVYISDIKKIVKWYHLLN